MFLTWFLLCVEWGRGGHKTTTGTKDSTPPSCLKMRDIQLKSYVLDRVGKSSLGCQMLRISSKFQPHFLGLKSILEQFMTCSDYVSPGTPSLTVRYVHKSSNQWRSISSEGCTYNMIAIWIFLNHNINLNISFPIDTDNLYQFTCWV